MGGDVRWGATWKRGRDVWVHVTMLSCMYSRRCDTIGRPDSREGAGVAGKDAADG
jgi:hypothetical protein